MSYCRFSSDDFQCDVYVYEDCMGGFTTHVAGRRVVYKEALPPRVPLDKEHIDAFVAREVRIGEMVDAATRVEIGLPHDGESFNDPDAAACAERLESLRALGYRVPQYAIDMLRDEAVGEDAA